MTARKHQPIGSVDCPFCGHVDAEVCRNAQGRLYYRDPNCYTLHPLGPGFQAWLTANMRALAPAADPTPPPRDAPREPNTIGAFIRNLLDD